MTDFGKNNDIGSKSALFSRGNLLTFLSLLLFISFSLSNIRCCIYSFTGAAVPTHLKTIAVPVADDRSGAGEPGLRELLTNQLTPSPPPHQRLGHRLQHCEAAFLARIQNAGSLCRYTQRAEGRNIGPGSSRRWMKVQWQVNSDRIGRKSVAHLDLTNPQIINGGQTAYTLCRLFDQVLKKQRPSDIFDNKEVLLKVITLDPETMDDHKRTKLIERISRATNLQTKVDDADRRSNDPVQIKLQKIFYEKYGLFYERKDGEFYDGLQAGYVDRDLVLNRGILMRVALANRFQLAEARSSIKKFFSPETFVGQLRIGEVDAYAFGYRVYKHLRSRFAHSQGPQRYRPRKYGHALRYGRFPVVAVALACFRADQAIEVTTIVDRILGEWRNFESWAEKRRSNRRYFEGQQADWSGYYKGETLNEEVRAYFRGKFRARMRA